MSHAEDRADLKPAEGIDLKKDSTVESDVDQNEETRTQSEEAARTTPPSGDAQDNEQEDLDDDHEPVPPGHSPRGRITHPTSGSQKPSKPPR